jgi:hypothetical protein
MSDLTIVDPPLNQGLGDDIYAWLAIDAEDDNATGIVGISGFPAVVQGRELAEKLRPLIAQLADKTPARRFELRRYHLAEVIQKLP